MSVIKNGAVFVVLIVICQFYLNLNYSNSNEFENEVELNVFQLIENFGYPVEIHEVISDDYVLTLHRIPPSTAKTQSNNQTNNRTPVLFVHGLLNSAAEFVNLGPEKALSLLLADKNYDVWLANVRGTTWSRKHTQLDPDRDKDQFWNFDFHGLSVEDLPAIIDYVLEVTNQSKLHYVGYSQGTVMYFIMASERPEYMDKIRLMTGMAPAVYINNSKGPVAWVLSKFPKLVETLHYYLDIHEFMSIDGFIAKTMKSICHENSILVNLCLHKIFIVHGYSYEQLNKTLLARIYTNLPAGVSVKQFSHLNQYLATGRFAAFDFGPHENQIKYGQIDPPLYNLTKATAPAAIYYGANDWLVQTTDVERLVNNLPNVVKTYLVPHEDFNHNDFLHATDADKLLYNSVIEEIEKY